MNDMQSLSLTNDQSYQTSAELSQTSAMSAKPNAARFRSLSSDSIPVGLEPGRHDPSSKAFTTDAYPVQVNHSPTRQTGQEGIRATLFLGLWITSTKIDK